MRAEARILATTLAAAVLCAGAAGLAAGRSAAPCAGLTPPRRLTTAPVALPPSFSGARVGGVVLDEAVIGGDGSVSGVRLVRARLAILAPFGEKSVRDSRFSGGAIEGNPVAVRVQIATTLGTITKARVEPEYDSLWAFVAGGQSREALWQLAGSVEMLSLVVHAGTRLPQGGEIVARAAGAERVLLKLPTSHRPVDLRETVSTGKFFWKAGDYDLELRAGSQTLARTTFTVADDHTKAIVNACEPI